MNCSKCGNPLTIEDKFCPGCGNPVPVANNNPQVQAPVIEELDAPAAPVNNMMNNNIQQPMMNNNVEQPMMNNNVQQPVMNNNMQQPINNGFQQPMMNNNVQQPMNNNTDKKGGKIGIVYIIGGVVALAVIILLIVLGGKGNSETPPTDGGSEATPVTNTASYKVQYGGYSFTIPDTLSYQDNDGDLLIGDEAAGWVITMGILDRNYNDYKSNLNKIQGNLKANGIDAKAAELKKVKGVEFVSVEFLTQGVNCVGAYIKLSPTQTVAAIAYNLDNTFEHDAYEEFIPIVSSAQKIADSNSISVKPEIKGILD